MIDPQLLNTLESAKINLDNGTFLRNCSQELAESKTLASFNLLTIKPMIYVCNVDESSIITGNELSKQVEKIANESFTKVLNISADIESEISLIENLKEKKEFLLSIGLKEASLSKLIKEGYDLLNLLTFFTTGIKESRAWSCQKGSFAPDAGAKIHTDFKRGFIKAEVIDYLDFIKFKGEQNCKEKGKVRLEGKEYLVKDGDIMNFKFNV